MYTDRFRFALTEDKPLQDVTLHAVGRFLIAISPEPRRTGFNLPEHKAGPGMIAARPLLALPELSCADCGIGLGAEQMYTGHDGTVRCDGCDSLRYKNWGHGLVTDSDAYVEARWFGGTTNEAGEVYGG